MSFGADWTCSCGWANLDIRKRCRNCGKTNAEILPAPSEPGAYEGDVYFGDVADTTRATHRWTTEGGWRPIGGPAAAAAVPFDQKAQAARCQCRGADEMCACQNQPDHETLRAALAAAGPPLSEEWLLGARAHAEEGFALGEPVARDLLAEVLRLRGLDPDAMQMATIAACMGQPQPGQALKDVEAERLRQIVGEGWTAKHDDAHADGEMAFAAATYALAATLTEQQRASVTPPCSLENNATLRRIWPWERSWWKPKDRRRDLVRAAALIVAEIERLDRAEAKKAAGP